MRGAVLSEVVSWEPQRFPVFAQINRDKDLHGAECRGRAGLMAFWRKCITGNWFAEIGVRTGNESPELRSARRGLRGEHPGVHRHDIDNGLRGCGGGRPVAENVTLVTIISSGLSSL